MEAPEQEQRSSHTVHLPSCPAAGIKHNTWQSVGGGPNKADFQCHGLHTAPKPSGVSSCSALSFKCKQTDVGVQGEKLRNRVIQGYVSEIFITLGTKRALERQVMTLHSLILSFLPVLDTVRPPPMGTPFLPEC